MVLKVVFILFVICSIANSERKYNTETFYINAKSSRLVNTQSANEYFVYNVGKPTVTVQILVGNMFHWKDPVAERVLKHGESTTFQLTGYAYYMAVKVINNENINGFVHAYATSRLFKEFDEASIDFFKTDQHHKLLQTLVVTGISKIPAVGEALSIIVDFFWPEEEENVWEQIEDQVRQLVDSRIQETVDGILGGTLEQFKTRMKTVLHEISNANYTETVGTHYVNIAEDLVGFEHRFKFKGENSINTNYFLLPLYATSVNLKLTLYQYGIQNWQKLRINKELVGRLTYYVSELIHNSAAGAIAHIQNTCKDKLDKEYRDAYPETIYDQLSSVHAYCALNGREHIPLWKAIAANPKVTPKKPDVPVLVYSTQFGRNTAHQSAQMVIPNHQSLTPDIINGKINIPVKITVFQTTNHLIAGMKITAANGRVYYTGRTNNPKNKIRFEFNGKRLVKLIAKGKGQINGLHFIFEDGRIIRAGVGFGTVREFAIDNHHIVGFYMTNSKTRINPDQAANIAVSYQVMMD